MKKPSSNQILDLLTTHASGLTPDLMKMTVDRGTVLHRADAQIKYVYFPIDALVSVLVVTKSGKTVEIAIIGRDGLIGSSVATGITFALSDATVRIGGTLLRLPVKKFRAACQASEHLRHFVARFDLALLAQVQQTAACNALHNVEARACRRLLQCRDRIRSDSFPLTQGFFAQMLGVQRTTLNLTGQNLQRAGLISYDRGRIQITDSKGLREAACECYGTIKLRYNQVLKPSSDV
jgi:CRP-like cAMP-binding protein